jgi:hypothetical protein
MRLLRLTVGYGMMDPKLNEDTNKVETNEPLTRTPHVIFCTRKYKDFYL